MKAPPLLLSLNPGMGMIHANYQFSGSDDVALHRLERLKVGTGMWVEMENIDRNSMNEMLVNAGGNLVFTYQDTSVEVSENYRYRMIALDSSENLSSSAVLTGTPLDDGIRGSIFNEDGQVVDLTDEFFNQVLQQANAFTQSTSVHRAGILIQWDYDALGGLKDFVIYRKRQNEPIREYATVAIRDGHVINDYNNIPSSSLGSLIVSYFYYLDTGITRSGYYEYLIIARHHDGGFSQMTDVINLIIN